MELLPGKSYIAECVPDRYQLFAAALRRRPDYWESDLAQLRADMALEANGSDQVETVCKLCGPSGATAKTSVMWTWKAVRATERPSRSLRTEWLWLPRSER